MTNTDPLLPIWSIRTNEAHLGFSLAAQPHEDLAMGRPLAEPPASEVTLATYEERCELELDEEDRSLTHEELASRSLAVEPLEYNYSENIWSSRLVDVTRAAGVDNLETWPIRLVHPLTGRSWDHVVVNVLGREGIAPRTLLARGLRLGRDEDSGTLLLSDPVKRAWERLGLSYLHFMKQHPRLP